MLCKTESCASSSTSPGGTVEVAPDRGQVREVLPTDWVTLARKSIAGAILRGVRSSRACDPCKCSRYLSHAHVALRGPHRHGTGTQIGDSATARCMRPGFVGT